MPQSIYSPQDFLDAELVVDYLLQNRTIQFQLTGHEMDQATAQRHFAERKALITVQRLLLDEADRVLDEESRNG